MDRFELRIYAIQRDFYTGPCESLTFQTMDGMVGVMAGHIPMVFAVCAGELHFTVDGETSVLAVGDGIAWVTGEQAVLLLDFAELASEIDEIRARDARERAEAVLQARRDDRSVAYAESALRRAMTRLRVVQKTRGMD